MSTKRNKPLKNYIILGVIFVAVILLVWYCRRWYFVVTDYKKETPVIRGTLNYEITANDFDSYIMENPSSVIYMCTSKDDNCRSFEEDFKKFVVKKNLQDVIIYLNLSDSDIDSFVNSFNEKYKYKIKLTKNYPLLVEFTDGKVTGIVQGSKEKRLTLTKVKNFIDINKIGKTN